MKRHLIVRQRGARDCGACSLLSIIRYYGGNVPLEKVRLDSYTSIEGTSFYHLLQCAKKYGLEGKGIMSDWETLNNGEVSLPVIAHLIYPSKLTHFVVIYKITSKYVIVMNPKSGQEKIEIAKFIQLWSKRLLVLYPIQKLLRLENKNLISNIFSSILPVELKLIIKLFITSLVLTMVSIISSFYFKIQLDAINNGESKEVIKYIFIIFLLLMFIKILISYIKNHLENYLNKNIDIHFIIPFIKHIFLLPLNIVKNKSVGEIISRISDLNSLKNIFSKILITFLLDLLLATTSIIVLFNVSSKLLFFLCFILLIYIIAGLIFSQFIYKKIMASIDDETEFNSVLVEKINGLSTIKSLHNYDYVLNVIDEYYVKYLNSNFKLANYLNFGEFGKNFIEEIGLFLITSFGIYLIFKNEINVLNLITFNSLLIYLFEPIKNIINMLPNINHFKILLEKINDFIDITEENIESVSENFSNGLLLFKNISYSYNGISNVLENISFEINKNEKVFIKGKSGVGKSTLCKLLYRLYNPHKGKIEIDDVNIKDYSLDTIRKNITYLSQKEEVFSGTLRDNILFGRKVSTKKLDNILKICKVDEIIDKKPLRLDSVILDGGFNLSGGEKQRVALARALIKESKIIILDEALSEVSSKMEEMIIKNINKNFIDRTIIYISHRKNEKLFDRIIKIGEENG